MEFQMRNKTFISSMVGVAAAVAVAGSANANTVDTNGGASWGGWNAYGNSDAAGVYGTGTNGVVYKIYQTVFRYDGQTMSLGSGYTGSSFTSAGPNASQMFQRNNLIYGLGIERVSGTGNMGTRTISFDLGNDTYQAANAAGGAKVSSSSWSQYQDFNTQFITGGYDGQIGVQLGNNPGPGGVSNFVYSGTSGEGGPEGFAYRAAGNGLNSQMFFDITAMNALYTQANAFAGWTVGINNIPNGALSPNQFRMSLDIGNGIAARTFIQSSDIWAAELPPIPAPGALALLGVAGLAGGRRRRA
jgi:MYXO-CTERM domain-containing protein